jgi:putative phosphoesterase
MKILVMSDSHSALSFMRKAVKEVKPNAIIHLGDHYYDGQVIAEENPHIPVHQVPGNCDMFRIRSDMPQFLCYDIGGVRFFMTHGHLHGVKSSPYKLISDARGYGAAIVAFGHTHEAVCFQEEGMWVLNPGSCGTYGGSVGLVQVENGKIVSCSILRPDDFGTCI